MADSFSEREIESFKYLRSLGMTPQEALDVLRICLGGGLFSKQGDEFILMGKDGKRMALPLMFALRQQVIRREKTTFDRFLDRVNENVREGKIDKTAARRWIERACKRKRSDVLILKV